MGSIPLPALAIHSAETPDPLSQVGKLLSVRSLLAQQQGQQLELQQKQQQMQDTHAATTAMMQWDGQDPDALSKSVLQNGGSASAAQGIAKHYLDIREQAAKTSKDEVDTKLKKNELIAGALESLSQVPDEQLPQAIQQAASGLAQQKLIDPKHAELANQLAQLPPAEARQKLDILKKGYQLQTVQFQQGQDKAELAVKQQNAATSEWKEAGQGTLVNLKTRQIIHGVAPVEQQELQDFLDRNKDKTPQDWPAEKSAREAAATQPYKLQVAAAEAKTRQAIEGMIKPVYAFDPRTQTKALMSQTDAQKKGLLGVPVNEKQISDDIQLTNRLTDVNNKIVVYEQNLKQPLSAADKGNIAALIKDDELKIGAFGTQLPTERLNAAMDAENIKNLSPQARDAILAYFNARESLVGYNRVLSGSGRSNESALQLQLKTLPNPATSDPDYSARALGQFKENLRIVGQGLPSLPGVKSPEEWERANPPGGGKGTTPTGGTVKMKAPNGQVKDIPADQVGHFKSLGATVVQ